MSSRIVKKDKDTVVHGDQEYTRQGCIDDLIQMQDDLDPGKSVTRKFYREEGAVPELIYEHFFGTFLEFRRAASILPTRAEQTLKSATARSAATDQLQKVWTERLDYGDRFLRNSSKRIKTILGFNDLHDMECDPFFLRILYDTAKRLDPDVICSNGDHFDLPEFGKYPVDPRDVDVLKRIDAGLEIFRRLREICPNAQIDLIEGNHEARAIRHLIECSPMVRTVLSDKHRMGVREFLGLDAYEINYVAKTDMKRAYTDAAIKKEIQVNHRIYWDSVCAHHYPPAKTFGMPGWNGHHHSHWVWHHFNAVFGSYEWHQFGCGHRRDATYTNGQKWANGFGIISVDTHARTSQITYIPVGITFCEVAGIYYHRREEETYDALRPMTDPSRIVLFPKKSDLKTKK